MATLYENEICHVCDNDHGNHVFLSLKTKE